MSKDQQIEQSGQQTAAGPSAAEPLDQTYGLRADLHTQIMKMTPADANALAEMIQLYPSLNGAILAVAASHMGNAAVQRAIALVKTWTAKTDPGALSHDEVHTTMKDAADSRPLKSNEMNAALHDASDAPVVTSPAAAPKPAAAPEPAWVGAARTYNRAHAELASEFDDLTDHFMHDDDGALDPIAISRWQANHGLDPDGKIGPRTVATARALKARTPDVAAAPQAGADARPPV